MVIPMTKVVTQENPLPFFSLNQFNICTNIYFSNPCHMNKTLIEKSTSSFKFLEFNLNASTKLKVNWLRTYET